MRKQRIKRITAILLALSMLFSLSVNFAFAAPTPLFEVVSVEAKAGDIIDIPLNISNNPGITALSIDISYPAEQLELIAAEGCGSYAQGFSSGKLTVNPFRISWYSPASQDVTENGTAAVLRFKVLQLDTAARITLSYEEDNVFNSVFVNQFFAVKNGSVATHIHTLAPSVKVNEVPATCSAEGSYEEVVYCTVCGAEVSRTRVSLPKTAHDFSAFVKTVEPTCTEQGYDEYRCAQCTATDKMNFTQPLGHKFIRRFKSELSLKAPASADVCARYYYSCVRCDAVDRTAEHFFEENPEANLAIQIEDRFERKVELFLMKNNEQFVVSFSSEGSFSLEDLEVGHYEVFATGEKGLTTKLKEIDVGEADFGMDIDLSEISVPIGNVNGDAAIDISDVAYLLQADVFGTTDSAGDLNDDNLIDMGDLSLILKEGNFGASSVSFYI